MNAIYCWCYERDDMEWMITGETTSLNPCCFTVWSLVAGVWRPVSGIGVYPSALAAEIAIECHWKFFQPFKQTQE